MDKTKVLVLASVVYVLIGLASVVPILIGWSFSAEGRRGQPAPLHETLFMFGLGSFPIAMIAAVILAWILRAAGVEWHLAALALPAASVLFVLVALLLTAV